MGWRPSLLVAIALRLEAITLRFEAIDLRLEAMPQNPFSKKPRSGQGQQKEPQVAQRHLPESLWKLSCRLSPPLGPKMNFCLSPPVALPVS